MFQCSLCRTQCTEWVFVQSHCSQCEEIRRIISLYSKEEVLNTLRNVYLRDDMSKVEARMLHQKIQKNKLFVKEKTNVINEMKLRNGKKK